MCPTYNAQGGLWCTREIWYGRCAEGRLKRGCQRLVGPVCPYSKGLALPPDLCDIALPPDLCDIALPPDLCDIALPPDLCDMLCTLCSFVTALSRVSLPSGPWNWKLLLLLQGHVPAVSQRQDA